MCVCVTLPLPQYRRRRDTQVMESVAHRIRSPKPTRSDTSVWILIPAGVVNNCRALESD